MKKTQQFLAKLKLPFEDNHALKPTSLRFKDGGQYRFEIPSVEGPRVFREVLDAAKDLNVPIHRVSQGRGVMLLTKAEISEMAHIGHDQRIVRPELPAQEQPQRLFVGRDHQLRINVAFGSVARVQPNRANGFSGAFAKAGHEIEVLLIGKRLVGNQIDRAHPGSQGTQDGNLTHQGFAGRCRRTDDEAAASGGTSGKRALLHVGQ